MLATQQAQSQLTLQIQTYPCCNWLEYWVWLMRSCGQFSLVLGAVALVRGGVCWGLSCCA
jgi:hypothetical protein